MLWRALCLPNFAGARLHGYLDGSSEAPPQPSKKEPVPMHATSPTLTTRSGGPWTGRFSAISSARCTRTCYPAHRLHLGYGGLERHPFHVRCREPCRCPSFPPPDSRAEESYKSASEYMQKTNALADAMAAARSPCHDDPIINYMLIGLGSAYKPITSEATSGDRRLVPISQACIATGLLQQPRALV
jgi:hypothetical protein